MVLVEGGEIVVCDVPRVIHRVFDIWSALVHGMFVVAIEARLVDNVYRGLRHTVENQRGVGFIHTAAGMFHPEDGAEMDGLRGVSEGVSGHGNLSVGHFYAMLYL